MTKKKENNNNSFGWLDNISDFIISIEQKVGFKRFLQYVLVCLVILGLFNFKSVIKGGIELVQEIQEDIHIERMEVRDELMSELVPMLIEFRAEVHADRILYFEYHNSNENLVGIPFKYADIVTNKPAYGVSQKPETNLRDINVSNFTDLYETIKTGKIVHCKGVGDTNFMMTYPGTYDIFKEGGYDIEQVFLSVPGVNQPIGFIVLEWIRDIDEEDTMIDVKEVERVATYGSNSYISRINGLIMSKLN